MLSNVNLWLYLQSTKGEGPPNISLECHRFNAGTPYFHRLVWLWTAKEYVFPGEFPKLAVKFNDNPPIKFSGLWGTSGSAYGNEPGLWDEVLKQLPSANIAAFDVAGTQGVLKVDGFAIIKEKLLAACEAMDH